jgi:hypothetical protein
MAVAGIVAPFLERFKHDSRFETNSVPQLQSHK